MTNFKRMPDGSLVEVDDETGTKTVRVPLHLMDSADNIESKRAKSNAIREAAYSQMVERTKNAWKPQGYTGPVSQDASQGGRILSGGSTENFVGPRGVVQGGKR